MRAAGYSALETVTVLLSLGANPDHLDDKNQPALYHALVTEVTPVILKLLTVTNNGLKSCFKALATTSTIGYSDE